MSLPGRELLEETEDDPASVPLERVIETIRDVEPSEYLVLFRAIINLLDEDPTLSDDLIEALIAELDADDEGTRVAAMRTLVNLSALEPDEIVSALPEILEHREDPFAPARGSSLQVLLVLAEKRPEEVIDRLDVLSPYVTDEVPYVGEVAVKTMRSLANDHPDELAHHVDPVIDFLADPPEVPSGERQRWMRYHPTYREKREMGHITTSDRERLLTTVAAYVAQLAGERPDALHEHVETLGDVIERERSNYVREHLLEAIGAVAADDPDAAADAIEPVAAVLEDARTAPLIAAASWTLAWLAEGHSTEVSDAVAEELPAVVEGLDADDDELAQGSAALLSYVAEHEPEAVEPALPQVRELLDSEEPQIRGLAVWIVGYVGEEDDRERLAELEREDPHPAVQSAAGEANEVLQRRLEAD